MQSHLIDQCAELLILKSQTIAIAESATAGSFCLALSLHPDAGSYLKGGVVCYSACVKKDLLQVPQNLLDRFTPESSEATLAIAKGMQLVMPADIHVGITGLTRSGGSETERKPVGSMFFCGLKGATVLFNTTSVFQGDSDEIIRQATTFTASLLITALGGGSRV